MFLFWLIKMFYVDYGDVCTLWIYSNIEEKETPQGRILKALVGALCLSPDASTMARGKKLWVCLLLPSSAGDFDPWVGKIPWSRKWQLTPVFSPGKFHRQRSLEGYSLCGHKELDTMSDWVHMLCFCMWLEAEGRGRDSFHKGWRKQKTHN